MKFYKRQDYSDRGPVVVRGCRQDKETECRGA